MLCPLMKRIEQQLYHGLIKKREEHKGAENYLEDVGTEMARVAMDIGHLVRSGSPEHFSLMWWSSYGLT